MLFWSMFASRAAMWYFTDTKSISGGSLASPSGRTHFEKTHPKRNLQFTGYFPWIQRECESGKAHHKQLFTETDGWVLTSRGLQSVMLKYTPGMRLGWITYVISSFLVYPCTYHFLWLPYISFIVHFIHVIVHFIFYIVIHISVFPYASGLICANSPSPADFVENEAEAEAAAAAGAASAGMGWGSVSRHFKA